MIEKEDKIKICNHLCEALKLTRHCENLQELNYFEATEEVIAMWDSGRRSIINVRGEDGWAMVQTIMKALAYGGG